GAFKDIPGGQILGPTYDYTHRLIEFEDEPELLQSQGDPQGDTGGTPGEKNEHLTRVVAILIKQGLMNPGQEELIGEKIEDLTRQPLKIPASRSVRLQAMARGDEGFLLGSAYSLQRGFGLDRHPFLGELRVGFVEVMVTPPELGFDIKVGEIKVTECFMINRNNGTKEDAPGFENGYGLVFGQNERKAMSVSLLDRSLQNSEKDSDNKYPARSQEFILSHSDNVESSGFVQHLKLPHYVDFQSELISIRNLRKKHWKNRKKKDESHL
ncbi:MAG: carbon-phosphorus lyase complex subunit PhnI, partial [Desulfobacula sp. GWF2_41_7]